MRVSSFLAKIWRDISGQAGPKWKCMQTPPSAAWIQERVHVAIGEEALQSDRDAIYRQWMLSPASSLPPSAVRAESKGELSPGAPGNGQTEKAFEVQQRNDCHLNLLVGWVLHPGIKRQHKPNEDSLFAVQGIGLHHAQPHTFGLFIVADGIGGHAHGQDASRLAIQSMIDWVLPKVFRSGELHEADCRQILINGVQAANRAIHQQNTKQHMEMGTTITAALVIDSTAFIANVGDSRTYLYRTSEGLRKVTQDHSLVAYLVEAGIIQPDDIYIHPQRNQIYRSLGAKSVIQVDTFVEPLQPDDILLLCSDGLWEMVRDPDILQILRHGAHPSQISEALLEAALSGGGADNISVIVIHAIQATGHTDVHGMQLLVKPETVEMPNLSHSELKQSSHE